MNIGIVKETLPGENRVALTPAGIHALTGAGHQVYVESTAGRAANFCDPFYEDAGAHLVYNREEIYGRSDVVVKVAPPTEEEADLLLPGQTLISFLLLAVAREQLVKTLISRNVTAIGMENILRENGTAPLQEAMSEIGGNTAIMVAAQYLRSDNSGRGVVLGSLPGVPASLVVVLGAGVLGRAASHTALGLGAQVMVLDKDIHRLRDLHRSFGNRLTTYYANPYNIDRSVRNADVVIGAVMATGHSRTPVLVSRSMVANMKKGAVIVDASVDLGGCVATTRPTTIWNPIFVHDDVIHYCVPNMASTVARTASHAINNHLLEYLLSMAERGVQETLKHDAGMAAAVYTMDGRVYNPNIASIFNYELHSIGKDLS